MDGRNPYRAALLILFSLILSLLAPGGTANSGVSQAFTSVPLGSGCRLSSRGAQARRLLARKLRTPLLAQQLQTEVKDVAQKTLYDGLTLTRLVRIWRRKPLARWKSEWALGVCTYTI